MAEKKITESTPLSPSEYFQKLKDKSFEADLKELYKLRDNAMQMMKRYMITGQKSGAQKLYRFVELCEREAKIVRAGFTTYINREDLDNYISNVADKAVVIGKLEEYERDLPDDIIDKVALAKEQELFDEYCVVFTDYTGKVRKKVEADRREKDPILLGMLRIGQQISTRCYHIGSWVDEYCDLTLDKMVKEFDAKHHDFDGESMQKSLVEQFGSYEDFKRSFDAYKKQDQ